MGQKKKSAGRKGFYRAGGNESTRPHGKKDDQGKMEMKTFDEKA